MWQNLFICSGLAVPPTCVCECPPLISPLLTQCVSMGEHLGLKIAFTFDLRGNCCMCASTQMMMYLWLVAEKKVRKMLLLQPAPRSKACFYGWSNQRPLGWCVISQYFKGLFSHWWFHWNTWMFDISEAQLQQWFWDLFVIKWVNDTLLIAGIEWPLYSKVWTQHKVSWSFIWGGINISYLLFIGSWP